MNIENLWEIILNNPLQTAFFFIIMTFVSRLLLKDLFDDFIDMLRKPKKQDPISTDIFRMRFDDGLFNMENYSSVRGDKND